LAKSINDKKTVEQIETVDDRKFNFYQPNNDLVLKAGKIIGVVGCAVYNSLLCHAGNKSRDSWPSIETIAEEWNCSKHPVINAIALLEQLHMITTQRKTGKPNKYHLNDVSEWRLEITNPIFEGLTSAPDAPVEGLTSAPDAPVPVHQMHSNYTYLTILKETYLGSVLFEEIIKANPYSKLKAQTPKQKDTTITRWAKDIEKLLRIDKQDPSIIEEVIKKATHDDVFWGRNILSGDALRRNWDRLTHQFVTKKPENTFTEKEKKKPAFVIGKDGIKRNLATGEPVNIPKSEVESLEEIQAAIREGLYAPA
jgi:hypothetical protein